MTNESVVQTQLEFSLPIDVVRRHFFDIDAAVAGQIYHGVRLSAVAQRSRPDDVVGADEETRTRRLRREIHVLDRVVIDEVEVGPGDDGTWTVAFVEGPNAGGRFVARFAAGASPVSTVVSLEAHAPPAGFAFGLGKLSSVGIEKTLQKMLKEHQRAIEGDDLKARTTAVKIVLAGLDDLTGPARRGDPREQKALVALLLEVAGVVAIADGSADAEERAVMDEVALSLCDTALDEEARGRLVRSAETAVAKAGMAARCELLGRRLKTLGCAELGLAVAAVVAEASHGIDPPEVAALQQIAAAAGIREAAVPAVLKRIGEAIAEATPEARARVATATGSSTTLRVQEAPAKRSSPPVKKPPPLPPRAQQKKGESS